ncbi:MAG: transposase [Cytophagaceae bacterium]|jgi:REP element-mobilizing transposase RayT|nr:transposase [Cytophagaceae bacterium]
MSRKYRIDNERHAHFVTFTVINWIDFFIREEYRSVLVKSLEYCQQHKGLEIHAYCIMTSRIHLIIGTNGINKLENIIRDFKRHTSGCFHKLLTAEDNNYKSRKEWLLWMMERAGMKKTNTNGFQFWQHDSHPMELWSDEVFYQKMNYIHLNPVVSGFVSQPEEWLYSSARNYAELPSLIRLVDDSMSPSLSSM